MVIGKRGKCGNRGMPPLLGNGFARSRLVSLSRFELFPESLCFPTSMDPVLFYRFCVHPNFVSSKHACAHPYNAAWKYPPSRGRVTDAREKESPLPIYDPKVEGR
ncbi:hypothetical protein CRG98_016979 [Punica granatum]|uniref:Uncharacterized protein n=1 Tax=Punica granatum TaxID=22663 RepID=A0A2I0K247_PUNGR|nr:hypothetical protein CRG98_016979 [Punica granatum]